MNKKTKIWLIIIIVLLLFLIIGSFPNKISKFCFADWNCMSVNTCCSREGRNIFFAPARWLVKILKLPFGLINPWRRECFCTMEMRYYSDPECSSSNSQCEVFPSPHRFNPPIRDNPLTVSRSKITIDKEKEEFTVAFMNTFHETKSFKLEITPVASRTNTQPPELIYRKDYSYTINAEDIIDWEVATPEPEEFEEDIYLYTIKITCTDCDDQKAFTKDIVIKKT